jgi:site-specific recombinase XerD
MSDIYNTKRRLERILERIEKSNEISDENREILFGFNRELSVQNISMIRRDRQLGIMFNIVRERGLDLKNATVDELKDVVDWIHTNYSSAETIQTMKLTIRKIYQFIDELTEQGASPKRLKWMKTTIKKSKGISPEDLLTLEEIGSMLKFASSRRDKALIFVLYESGGRIGEIGGLRIKDISFDDNGARIKVSGKTGYRIIRIVLSAPYLLDWVNNHPNSGDRDSFIWVSKLGEQLCYSRLSSIIRQTANKAGIKKKVNPHNFRHSRATKICLSLPDAVMKSYFGWGQDSKMLGKYLHLSGKDNDDPILEMYGIKKAENNGDVLEDKRCLRCGKLGKFTDVHCSGCGAVLNEEVASNIIKKEQERANMDKLLNKLTEDPEILELIKKKLG